jgi:hypothetical protein
MPRINKEQLLRAISRAIDDALDMDRRRNAGDDDINAAFYKVRAAYRHIMAVLGEHAEPFDGEDPEDNFYYDGMLGALLALKDAVEDDLLVQVESLVFAEAFNDLLEQADHLLSQSYTLAAGVLGRAVLEEHLRKLCDTNGCQPSKNRPTMVDFYDALHRAGAITKIERKHVESMAAVGNEAAHNKAVSTPDIERLLRDVRAFVALHPIF